MSLIEHQKCNKYKSVTKYISVFAPGTLGIYQTPTCVPVSNWVVRRHCINVSIFNIWLSNYQNNLQYMGLSNTSKINLQHMQLWVIGALSM